jgi:hypothetical protein
MRLPRNEASWNLRPFAAIVRARRLFLATCLMGSAVALAQDTETVDPFDPAQPQRSIRSRETADDGFVPITKVVPRAKIVLRDRQRLPDLGGANTFATHGKRTINYYWYDNTPGAPMYAFAYNPIYFEDMNLERCGRSCGCCVQPFVSGIQFFGTVAILPYKMLVSPPGSHVCPPGETSDCCRFSCCESFFGPCPDLKGCLNFGKFWRKDDSP